MGHPRPAGDLPQGEALQPVLVEVGAGRRHEQLPRRRAGHVDSVYQDVDTVNLVASGRGRRPRHRPAGRGRAEPGSTGPAATTASSPSPATASTPSCSTGCWRPRPRSSPSPRTEKAEIAMARGGRAWRGWFPLAGELTSGVPDRKEGIYFGAEGQPDDPLPLHGPNLFPARPAELGPTVLAALDAFTALGHRLMGLLALGLGLDEDWFARDLTADPTILFRIFHYPPEVETDGAGDWGVAEHTDYGLLTLLLQDDQRRPPGAHGRRVARHPAGARGAGLQPRRHARAPDRGPVPLHPAPGAQPRRRQAASPARSSSTPAGTPRSNPCPCPTRRRASGSSAGTTTTPWPGRAPTAPTSSAAWPRSSPTSSTTWSRQALESHPP